MSESNISTVKTYNVVKLKNGWIFNRFNSKRFQEILNKEALSGWEYRNIIYTRTIFLRSIMNFIFVK